MDQKKSITSEENSQDNLEQFKGKINLISKYEIMKKSKFGRSSLDHTFTSEATFEHILIFILKGEYLTSQDKKSLFNTHPLFKHFNNTLEWSKK